jgi:hypothetical protein
MEVAADQRDAKRRDQIVQKYRAQFGFPLTVGIGEQADLVRPADARMAHSLYQADDDVLGRETSPLGDFGSITSISPLGKTLALLPGPGGIAEPASDERQCDDGQDQAGKSSSCRIWCIGQ